MNERIKELAAKAAGYAEDSDGPFDEVYTARFAELIVKECANIVTSLGQHEGPGDSSTAEYIKEHFGVK